MSETERLSGEWLGCPDCNYALQETEQRLECPGCGRSTEPGGER